MEAAPKNGDPPAPSGKIEVSVLRIVDWRKPVWLLSGSFISTVVALGVAFLLFRRETGLVAVFLLSFTLLLPLNRLLEENREGIWVRKNSPYRENMKLAGWFVLMFAGIFLAFSLGGLVALSLPSAPSGPAAHGASRFSQFFANQADYHPRIGEAGLADLTFGSFSALLKNNIRVGAIFFLISIIYRGGGTLLVIAWNASVWGTFFAAATHAGPAAGFFVSLGRFLGLLPCILPHMICEVAGYILLSMAGIFISKAVLKYSPTSFAFQRVGRAVLMMAVIGCVCLLAGAAVESELASRLARAIFG